MNNWAKIIINDTQTIAKETSKFIKKEEWNEYWSFGDTQQIGHEAMFPDKLPRHLIIKWILNTATNRWRLNKKESVDSVSLWIRRCEPKNNFTIRRTSHVRKPLWEILSRSFVEVEQSIYLERFNASKGKNENR